jgi:hypothetical protein
MNILEYRFTPNLLEIIARSEGKANWYSLEQRMGRLEGYGEYPALYMVDELVKLGYLKKLLPQENSKYHTFKITQSGLNLLKKYKVKEMK